MACAWQTPWRRLSSGSWRTVTINIPLNKKLETLDVDAMNETTQNAARKDFEPRWNLCNLIRAAFASLASALLIILLFRL